MWKKAKDPSRINSLLQGMNLTSQSWSKLLGLFQAFSQEASEKLSVRRPQLPRPLTRHFLWCAGVFARLKKLKARHRLKTIESMDNHINCRLLIGWTTTATIIQTKSELACASSFWLVGWFFFYQNSPTFFFFLLTFLNKTIIPLALVGNELIVPKSYLSHTILSFRCFIGICLVVAVLFLIVFNRCANVHN